MEKDTYIRYMIVEKVTGRFLLPEVSTTNMFTNILTLAEIWGSEDRAEDHLLHCSLDEYCEVVQVQITYEEIK